MQTIESDDVSAKIKKSLDDATDVLRMLVADHGDVPTGNWLKANGYSDLLKTVKKHGGLNKFRKDLGLSGARYCVSRGGLVLRSWAEVSLANFLWAREIVVCNGRKYPEEYAELSGQHCGWYDLEFDATMGEFAGMRILIEIWGDSATSGPMGSDREKYVKVKAKKLAFNASVPNFLSLSFSACYVESELIEIFAPYIGIRQVTRFTKDADKIVPPALWSTADAVVEVCQKICVNLAVDILPPVTWFTREGQFCDRATYDWEAQSWHQMMHKIQAIGGFKKVRVLLGQGEYYKTWDKERVAEEIATFYSSYGKWPVGDTTSGRSDLTTEEKKSRRKLSLDLCKLMKQYFESTEQAYSAARQLLPASAGKAAKRELPVGVSERKNGKFQAVIKFRNRRWGLGTYLTVDAAHNAVLTASKRIQEGRPLNPSAE